jgi:hypothetical protein
MTVKNKIMIIIVYFVLSAGLFSYGRKVCPYCATGWVSLYSESALFKYAGMNIRFYNNSDRDVRCVTFNFFLYDKDGNPPFSGNNCVTVCCRQKITAYDTADFCISLDEYISAAPDEPYQTDYLYAGRIEYEDDTVWEDPYGVYVME